MPAASRLPYHRSRRKIKPRNGAHVPERPPPGSPLRNPGGQAEYHMIALPHHHQESPPPVMSRRSIACRTCEADRRASNSVGRNSEPRRDMLGRHLRSSGNREARAREAVAGGQPSASVPLPAVRAACRAGRNGTSCPVSNIAHRRPRNHPAPAAANGSSQTPIVRVLFARGGLRHRPDPFARVDQFPVWFPRILGPLAGSSRAAPRF